MTGTLTGTLAGALAGALGTPAHAQRSEPIVLQQIDVALSRLGEGIVGTSTTVITAEEIARTPGTTIQDILSLQPGIQTRSLFGAVNGVGTTVDMRGFGATASSNTLILVNGRRMNDWDSAGFDLSTIPRNAIERIEITRGNSGAVLYGDGAVGGVINVVTKTPVGAPPSIRIEGAVGSYRYGEGAASLAHSSGPFSLAAFGNLISAGGYRRNNALRQQAGGFDARYTANWGTAYLNVLADNQQLGLPGPRNVTLTTSQLAADRRGTSEPFNYGDKQGVQVIGGFSRTLGDLELIIDGSVRRKGQQAAFFSPFGNSYVDTVLSTYAVTPRAKLRHSVFGLQADAIVGIDAYRSDYESDRPADKGGPPVHRYDLRQESLAIYGQETIQLGAATQISLGGRLQRHRVRARDVLDPTAPGWFGEPEGIPLDRKETQHALHVGVEHWFNEHFGAFGRIARSFRVPNVDERVGMAPFGTPTTFDLRTQTSHDIEGGVRVRRSGFNGQASVFDMRLNNELHFNPVTFTNANLDPTRRYGVEAFASQQITDDVALKGGFAYTRAVFREGPNAGKDVPLVSRWTAHFGASWQIWGRMLVFDGVVRYVGSRRMDNDQRNFQPTIPAHTLVDVRLGGEYRNLFWSVTAQNLFDVKYFDYAVASATTFGTYNAYPQPGRVVMLRAGVNLP